MSKVWVVFWREFSHNIRKISFWLTTLGLPIFMMAIGAFIFIIAFYSASKSIKKTEKKQDLPFAIVDTGGIVDWELLNPKTADGSQLGNDPELKKLLDVVNLPEKLEEKVLNATAGKSQKRKPIASFDTIDQAEAALVEETISGYLFLPMGFPENPSAQVVWYDSKRTKRLSRIETHLRDQLLKRDLAKTDIATYLEPLESVERIFRFPLEEKESKREFDFDFSKMGIPMLFAIAMMMAVFFSSDRLLRGLMEEKQNRVIEILLSSVSADQLMAGKVLGLGLVGLVQLFIWILLAFLPAAALLTFFSLDLLQLSIFVTVFILGYFLISTTMLGLGSLGTNHQEASQWALICSLLSMSPFMLWPMVLQNLESGLVEFFTFFPFTAPMMVILRYGAGAMPLWKVAIVLVILVLANILAVKAGARLFRLGILLTGKNPNPLTVWRLLRQQ